MTRVRRVAALSVAGVVLACVAAPGMRAQQSTAGIPTFRSAIEAVAFEVFVTDAEGKPVTDLKVDDFELFEEGAPQPITTFTSMVIPIDPGQGRVEVWPEAPDVGTNAGPGGRTYVFAVDESGASLRSRLFLRRFLERYFGPNDVGAVVHVGRGLATDGQAFTGNLQLLLKSIDKIAGGYGSRSSASPNVPGVSSRNTVDTDTKLRLYALRDLTESLAKIPGRKTVLYFTGTIGFDMFYTVDYRGGVLMLAAEAAHAVVSAATRANVIFYPIDPAGLGTGSIRLEDKMDLTSLGSVTGGFALSDSNSFMQAFERVQRESSAYYTLGFNSTHTQRDGRLVRVEVTVKRPGLRVRSRDGYLAPLGERRTDKEGDASPALEAMASPVLTRGVSMQVSAAPYRAATRDNAVALTIDIDPDTLGLVARDGLRTGNLEVTYTAIDAKRRAYLGGRHTFPVSLTPAAYEQARVHGLRVASTLSLPKGTFELRVAAANGLQTGSVVHHFEVPDFSDGRLTMSAVAVTTGSTEPDTTLRPPRGTGATSNSVRCETPSCIVPLSREAPSAEEPLAAMPGPAIARRTFGQEEELVIFAEAYENGRQPAHRVTFTVTLEGEDQVVRQVASEVRASGGAGQDNTTHAFTGRVMLRHLPPGRYLLRAQAQSDARKNLVATRSIRIDVRQHTD